MSHSPFAPGASTLGRIIRVQAGKLRDLPYKGGAWTTAINKEALDGRVVVERDGIVGDEHTGSGPEPERALCCCPADHYTHWRAVLGLELPLGIFGENLTIEGAAEDAVCIGDTLRCGSVLLQVSQPRMPCYKQARRIGRPDFVKRIMETGRLGFLMRVLEPGTLQAGDVLQLLDRPHPDISVAAVVRAFRSPEDRAMATRLAHLALLASEWREQFTEGTS